MSTDTPISVTDQTFQQEVIDHSNQQPVIVDFYDDSVAPSKLVAKIMAQLAQEYADKIRVARVDTTSNKGLSQAFKLSASPTLMVFKQGALILNQAGAFPEAAYRDIVEQALTFELSDS